MLSGTYQTVQMMEDGECRDLRSNIDVANYILAYIVHNLLILAYLLAMHTGSIAIFVISVTNALTKAIPIPRYNPHVLALKGVIN